MCCRGSLWLPAWANLVSPYRDPERRRATTRERVQRFRQRNGVTPPVTPSLVEGVTPPVAPAEPSVLAVRQVTIRDRGYRVMGKALLRIEAGLDDGTVKPVPAYNAGRDTVALMDMSLKQPPALVIERTINRELLVVVEAEALKRLKGFEDGS